MKRFITTGLVAVAAMTMLGLGTASATPKPQTISLFEMDTSDAFTGGTSSNQPPKVGDSFLFTGNYYKWAGTRKGSPAGHLQVECTFLVFSGNSGSAQCSATAFLPGGAISVVGPLSLTAHTNKLVIVGGTGAYVGAQGYVATTNIGSGDSNTSADVFHITN